MKRPIVDRRQVLALAALAVATPAQAQAQAQARIPFRLTKGKIFVDVTVNGRAVEAVIDSGGARSGVDQVYASEVGVRPAGPSLRIRTIQGDSEARVSAGPVNLVVADRQLAMPILVTDYGPLTASVLHPVRVLLGADFLSGFVVEFDFEGRTMALHPRQGFAPPRAALAPLTRLAGAGTGSTARAPVRVEGVPIQALVDTGSDTPLIVTPAVARRLKLLSGRRVATTPMNGIGGESSGQITSARSIEFGGVQLADVPVQVAGRNFAGDANLGLGVLSRFHVWMDLAGGRLWLARNGDNSPQKRDLLGFYGVPDGDTDIRITFVSRPSPAATAGLKVGDVITTINGMPALQGSQAFAGAAEGTRLQLTLQGGASRPIVLGRYY